MTMKAFSTLGLIKAAYPPILNISTFQQIQIEAADTSVDTKEHVILVAI